MLKTIPCPSPSFSQYLKKNLEEKKYQKLFSMLKELSNYSPLLKPLEQIPGNAKFMKDLVTKKTLSFEPVDNVHHCSTMDARSLVEKREDLKEFTIPCTIGSLNLS